MWFSYVCSAEPGDGGRWYSHYIIWFVIHVPSHFNLTINNNIHISPCVCACVIQHLLIYSCIQNIVMCLCLFKPFLGCPHGCYRGQGNDMIWPSRIIDVPVLDILVQIHFLTVKYITQWNTSINPMWRIMKTWRHLDTHTDKPTRRGWAERKILTSRQMEEEFILDAVQWCTMTHSHSHRHAYLWHTQKFTHTQVHRQQLNKSVGCCTLTFMFNTFASSARNSRSLSGSNSTPLTISTVITWSSELAASSITRSSWLVISVKNLQQGWRESGFQWLPCPLEILK